MQSEVDLSYALTGFSLDDVVVFDTETTGLDPYGGDEIVSIGICDGHGNKLFYSLVKPTRKRGWKEAEAIHGISPQDVKDAPKIKQIADEIRSHILGDKLVVGYNVEYDLMMLDAAGVIDGMPPARFDVMRQYATVHGTSPARYGREGYQWSKLTECAAHYGYTFPAHNSAEDAVAAAFCYRSLLSDMAWARDHYRDISPKLKKVSLKQNKDSTASIKALVESGVSGSVPAELRLGEITNGANKGAPRYECYLDDMCIGVQGYGDLESIKRLFMVGSIDDLPKVIKCRATITLTNGKAKCVANVTENGKVLEKVKKSAPKATPPSIPFMGSSVEGSDERMTVGKAGPKKMLLSTSLAVVAAFTIFMSLYGLYAFEFSVPWLMTELVFVVPSVLIVKKIKKILS